MDQTQFTRLVSFIWSIADDVSRDVCTRRRYRNVILPMTDELLGEVLVEAEEVP